MKEGTFNKDWRLERPLRKGGLHSLGAVHINHRFALQYRDEALLARA
jgi:hypothetical protein